MDRTTYYWEADNSHGQYQADDDASAIEVKPKGCITLYKESDTKDGTPFIIVWDWWDGKKPPENDPPQDKIYGHSVIGGSRKSFKQLRIIKQGMKLDGI